MSNLCVNRKFVDSIAKRGGNTRNKLIDKILELRDNPELQKVYSNYLDSLEPYYRECWGYRGWNNNNTTCNKLKERTMYNKSFICTVEGRSHYYSGKSDNTLQVTNVERASLVLDKIINEWKPLTNEDSIPEQYDFHSIVRIRDWGNDPLVLQHALDAPEPLLKNESFFLILKRLMLSSTISKGMRDKLLTTFPQKQKNLNELFSVMDQYPMPINGGKSRKVYRYKRKIMKNYRRCTRRKKNTKVIYSI